MYAINNWWLSARRHTLKPRQSRRTTIKDCESESNSKLLPQRNRSHYHRAQAPHSKKRASWHVYRHRHRSLITRIPTWPHAPNRSGTTVQFTNSSIPISRRRFSWKNCREHARQCLASQTRPISRHPHPRRVRSPLFQRPVTPASSTLLPHPLRPQSCHLHSHQSLCPHHRHLARSCYHHCSCRRYAKLFIDNAALPPGEQSPETFRPVFANIRDYLDSLAFDHGGHGFRAVWNGLDPDVTDINEYSA